MRLGSLSKLFTGVAFKRLTPHEVDPEVSNGHEFQGVAKLRDLLGNDTAEFKATYFLLSDEEPTVIISAWAKWYDSRENDPTRSAEWRLYYPAAAGEIQSRMRPGALMVVAMSVANSLMVALAPAGSTRELQLRALFGIGEVTDGPIGVQRYDDASAITSLGVEMLEELVLPVPAPDSAGDGERVLAMVEELSKQYPDALPTGKVIAELVQARFPDVDPTGDPDGTLIRWIEAEASLFRLWEDGLIERRLVRGFALKDSRQDVQGFRDFAMKTRQSRVSRAGGALQLHAATIMRSHKLIFEEQAITEKSERPDFLFPAGAAYHDERFPKHNLRLLAAKFTAKERWRQVLKEAARIEHKHLLTMDAAISQPQLVAMREAKLQPVVPKGYHQVYVKDSQRHLSTFGEFIAEVRKIQS